ncbi:MAG TPA: peptide chain release factor 1 [Lachnospiraceae bacterium]|nr:peptide chain release factor 1 [Lachnospiraceae bacterium]
MLEKLEALKRRYDELSESVSDPEVIADNKKWQELMKEHSELSPIAEKYDEYTKLSQQTEQAYQLYEQEHDEELRALAKEEIDENEKRLEELKNEIKILLIPKDPDDEKNVIMEIRGGAGGDEANIFAGDLTRMYIKYAETRNWKVEMMSQSVGDSGGYKEISFLISGKDVYSRLKFESGVHRVQRIPVTESGGRIHTSTVTVAVLPEVEEREVKIDPKDYRFDVFRASGNGGQCVNTTDSAVRLTHYPTGIVISCQDEKSQLRNKEKAMKILLSKLYDMEAQRQHDEMASERKSQVGRGNRNERIRTYNYPQGRVTDHRIGLTLHKLDSIINGDLDEITDALITTATAEKLNNKGDML